MSVLRLLPAAGLALALAAPVLPTPAAAASSGEYAELCADAVDAEGLASRDDYRARFIKAKGGGAKRVTILLVPNGAGDEIEAECVIRRGEVLEVALDV